MAVPFVAVTALACAMLLAASLPISSAIETGELTFAAIKAQNATKQWTLALALGNLASPDFEPVNCSIPAVGACSHRPLQQDSGDLLRVTYTLANPRGVDGALKTYNSAVPTRVEFRACYTLASSVDRAWRKKNKPYPRLSQNCPRKFHKVDFNGTVTAVDTAANSGVAVMNFNDFDEIPTATWFVMMWVYCGDAVCAFESTEGVAANATAIPPVAAVPGNFFETAVELGITPGMRAAAIVLSVVGPAIFIGYYIADSIHYKKTGRPLIL